jgi:hypothetical protein
VRDRRSRYICVSEQQPGPGPLSEDGGPLSSTIPFLQKLFLSPAPSGQRLQRSLPSLRTETCTYASAEGWHAPKCNPNHTHQHSFRSLGLHGTAAPTCWSERKAPAGPSGRSVRVLGPSAPFTPGCMIPARVVERSRPSWSLPHNPNRRLAVKSLSTLVKVPSSPLLSRKSRSPSTRYPWELDPSVSSAPVINFEKKHARNQDDVEGQQQPSNAAVCDYRHRIHQTQDNRACVPGELCDDVSPPATTVRLP